MLTQSELAHKAAVPVELLDQWIGSETLAPGRGRRGGAVFTFEDVMIAALLMELRVRRLGNIEIRSVACLLYESMKAADAVPVEICDLPQLLYHGTIQFAEAEGCFEDLARSSDVDPNLRHLGSYSAYLEWLEAHNQAPPDYIIEAAKSLDPISIDLIRYYFELLDGSYLTTPGVIPLWDIVPFDGNVRILSRSTVTCVPWDIETQADLASFVTISLPVLARQVAARDPLSSSAPGPEA